MYLDINGGQHMTFDFADSRTGIAYGFENGGPEFGPWFSFSKTIGEGLGDHLYLDFNKYKSGISYEYTIWEFRKKHIFKFKFRWISF